MTLYSRRALLRGAGAGRSIRRPPWTAGDFHDACTRCGACLDACPHGLLFKGDGGYPEISFADEGCDFCGKCAESCPDPVFDLTRPAFDWRIAISAQCLAIANIDCQSCQDACEPRAITFRPTLGRAPQPQAFPDLCTGCGACLPVCPASAIQLESSHV